MEIKQDNVNTQGNMKTIVATCPACGLLCDDVLIENKQSRIKVLNTACPKSIQFFEQPLSDDSPKINGESVTLKQAISHAAGLLKTSKKPLFAGLSTDVQGFRAIYNLANKTNGSLQHINAQSMARNMAVLQSSGWQTTTLTEVKNRADVIVCIGTDIVSHNTRFFERFVWLSNQQSDAMFIDSKQREVIYIGENLNTKAGASPDGKQPTSLNCSTADLSEIMAVLRALIAGKILKTLSVAGIQISDLIAVADKLKKAKYAVLAWIAKDLDFPHAELTIQSITETVALLNQNDNNSTGRAAGLSLGGSDGDTTANNANTWLSGFSLNNEKTDHDAIVWVNSFNAKILPTQTPHPLIVLGNANTKLEQTPDVFIPIATPGLDCGGTLFRVDSAVILPLKKVRENNLPTLSEVARQIEALLK
ncbi:MULTISPECIES: formylmethanofuran dehydrogenase [Methylotenera]|uniref:formylmethanofuran dehydrogenase n=1 Tax=Methylotenera TaxID=359407 RepID=UPI0003A5CA95|nr:MULTISPECIES: formylmethanofuran dehydrogenase [Methylotenera]